MKRLLNKKFIILSVILLVLAAASVFFGRSQRAAANEYFTAAVDHGPLRHVVNATGTVQTLVTVQVGSQVSGQIQELYADYNSVVKRGQLLAKLDSRNFDTQVLNSRANISAAQARVKSSAAEIQTNVANLQSSKANLEAARIARDNALTLFKRAAELTQSGLNSKTEYDNSKANADSAQAKYEQAVAAVAQVDAQGASAAAQLDQSKAQLAQAQADLDRSLLNLEYCNIYSPVDGVVVSRSIDVGQTLAASMQAPTLFSIATDLTRMQVHASVDEADIGNISSAGDVQFTVDAYPNDLFKGKISEIRLSPQTVQNVVTYTVILGIDNSEMKLRPGMTANIAITVAERGDALKIPNSSLRYTPPGLQREQLKAASGAVIEINTKQPQKTESNASAMPLAPGQMWNPSQKIQFAAAKPEAGRPGIAFVLNSDRKPQQRHVTFGMTDGSFTEILSGDLKAGDLVIVGDNATSGSTAAQAAQQNGGQRRGF